MLASLRLRAVTSIIFSCCALVTPVSAQDEDVFSEARARLEAGLSAMVGSPISIDRIEETPSKDLIEIAIAQGLFYTQRVMDAFCCLTAICSPSLRPVSLIGQSSGEQKSASNLFLPLISMT